MSTASVQFIEIAREFYAHVEAAKERGEIIVNVTAAFVDGEIDQATYDDLIARACWQKAEE